jgi:hypothetical protein
MSASFQSAGSHPFAVYLSYLEQIGEPGALASQLRWTELRATTGNLTVRAYGRHPLGMPRPAE